MTYPLKFKVWDKKHKKMSQPFTFGDLFGYEGEVNAVTLSDPYNDEVGQDFTIASHSGGSMLLFPAGEADNGVNPDLAFLLYTGQDLNGTEVYDGDLVSRGDSIGEVYWSQMLLQWVVDSADGGHEPDKAIPLARLVHRLLPEAVVGNVYEAAK